MRIDAEKERAVDALLFAVEADRLRDREDMRLVEGELERRPSMARCAEGDALPGFRRIGTVEIALRQPGDIDELAAIKRFARKRADG